VEVIQPIIKVKELSDRIALEPLGCIHVGNINFNEKKFLERRDAILNDPYRYTLGMGDYADAIGTGATQMTDKRFNMETIDPNYLTPDRQYEYIRQQLDPIKHKILGLLEGNHDYVLEEKTGHLYVRELARDLGVPYLGYAAFIVVNFKRNGKLIRKATIFAGHSHFNGTSAGGNLNNINRASGYFEADVYLTGHTHRTLFDESLVVGVDDTGQIVKYPKILASTGSFMETYVKGNLNYAEKNLLPATKTGTITIAFDPGTGKIHALK
jgi:hypothetical protein